MTENGMDFQSNPPTLPNLEENLLSCERFEPPGMDLEEGPQSASDYELNSSTSHQLSSHFSTLSFVTPDMSSSVGTTQPCGADDASWYLTQQDGVFGATAPKLNTSNLIHLNTTNDSAAALCPGVYEESSRMMGDGETPECDQSWRDRRAGSPGALQVFEQGHAVFGRVQQRDLMSMDLDEQPEGRKSQTAPTWSLIMEDDHLHIKELLTQLHTHHPGSSNDTDSIPVLEQLSKANPDFAARPGLDAMEEKDTQDVHIKLELQSDCPPCPLHIATGRGMVLQERRGQQPVYVQGDAENTSQRGLLFAEADREDLLNLLRCQRVTPTDLGHGTPLARSEALVGTTVDVFSQKGILEQDGCGVVELPSHYPCSQEAGCGCTTTGLERLVVGTESTHEWPETEEATKDSVCMSPSSPDQCPMTARVRMPSQPAPEELPSNNMVESVSFYPALKEVPGPCEPEDLLDGVIFGAKYLGSTQLTSERNPSTSTRMRQAQEAVDRIKAPDGESQPMTEVDLFVSTKRIKVLTADSQEAMMDHPLQTISYIADIGSIVVLMARRKLPRKAEESVGEKRLYKMICHVFHSADAQVIAQAIGQAFSVAYQQFLHSSGIDPSKLTPDEFSDVLSKEELYNGDLVHFSKQENCKEICIQKQKGDILGVAIVESGWGSILPTVVIANLMHGGPAEKSGELSIGDRIMSINGTSLVGLPLATCQNIIRDLRPLRDVTLSIVHCPPVTTAIIRRPDSKHQLGFCVEDGIICSLMRGGIAERGGIRVGHRIIEINDQSVVATPHEKIIQTLMNAVGEVHIKTMPASTYRLLTGQEQPIYL